LWKGACSSKGRGGSGSFKALCKFWDRGESPVKVEALWAKYRNAYFVIGDGGDVYLGISGVVDFDEV
jgi:hypothetical protein